MPESGVPQSERLSSRTMRPRSRISTRAHRRSMVSVTWLENRIAAPAGRQVAQLLFGGQRGGGIESLQRLVAQQHRRPVQHRGQQRRLLAHAVRVRAYRFVLPARQSEPAREIADARLRGVLIERAHRGRETPGTRRATAPRRTTAPRRRSRERRLASSGWRHTSAPRTRTAPREAAGARRRCAAACSCPRRSRPAVRRSRPPPTSRLTPSSATRSP